MRSAHDLDSEHLIPPERVIERQVRRVKCPVCGARSGQRCGSACYHAHTGRYRAAAKRGFVKPLPGES
jgi:hypothetical protein